MNNQNKANPYSSRLSVRPNRTAKGNAKTGSVRTDRSRSEHISGAKSHESYYSRPGAHKQRSKSNDIYGDKPNSNNHGDSGPKVCEDGQNIYGSFLGPTLDEKIFAGLDALFKICDVCPEQQVKEEVKAETKQPEIQKEVESVKTVFDNARIEPTSYTDVIPPLEDRYELDHQEETEPSIIATDNSSIDAASSTTVNPPSKDRLSSIEPTVEESTTDRLSSIEPTFKESTTDKQVIEENSNLKGNLSVLSEIKEVKNVNPSFYKESEEIITESGKDCPCTRKVCDCSNCESPEVICDPFRANYSEGHQCPGYISEHQCKNCCAQEEYDTSLQQIRKSDSLKKSNLTIQHFPAKQDSTDLTYKSLSINSNLGDDDANAKNSNGQDTVNNEGSILVSKESLNTLDSMKRQSKRENNLIDPNVKDLTSISKELVDQENNLNGSKRTNGNSSARSCVSSIKRKKLKKCNCGESSNLDSTLTSLADLNDKTLDNYSSPFETDSIKQSSIASTCKTKCVKYNLKTKKKEGSKKKSCKCLTSKTIDNTSNAFAKQTNDICGCKDSSSSANSEGTENVDEPSLSQMSDGNIENMEIRYAITKITKFSSYTTFEVMKSTKKQPKVIPSKIEGVFVLKNKKCIN